MSERNLQLLLSTWIQMYEGLEQGKRFIRLMHLY